jgi:hypothetical protein
VDPTLCPGLHPSALRDPPTRISKHVAEVLIAFYDDFGAILKEMRIWLDKHRFVPSIFTYSDLSPGMRVRVWFKVGDETRAFARRFGGSLTSNAEMPG